ncbi:NUDIX domain-containing protein [Proteiniborus sp. MB09-C3]|uniref:NUDIX hydrolase n=1 Tax=Proteiniborus sp. MB09-C3 TaxID=3050072 RepID=UPI002557BAAE|nr:NUDIX domain-containing protein [Proteiniborus sp. MB09-C3]WIV12710.1 NUDIX domain-containing protein [Proteiniborus sp. MB09-C3]
MGERSKSLSAIFPIILQKEDGDGSERILLHRRKNTGYQDGKWDIAASGHVDEGETARMAVVRECAEELGIDVNITDLSFAHLSHRVSNNGGRTYYDIYFVVNRYDGIPKIMEPDKCSELRWFKINDLPDEIIDIRKLVIDNCRDKIQYSEVIQM